LASGRPYNVFCAVQQSWSPAGVGKTAEQAPNSGGKGECTGPAKGKWVLVPAIER